ncbi:hypothetical protein [Actinophytocola oryzae]|uniref:Uncharacterized protein n=1 Tax=Actinophytocola oryzae TaxID=502181 RepID=A0A4R7VVK1_9PSEU|nr:hypothetical protein [Actinophytocola oryzae]TDV53924.1 hypothetical protein CLV71_104392 [Actinophytocola oryzae]
MDADPHIHVDRRVVEARADFRGALSSVLGAVPDAPGIVTTGCGIQAGRAMTSTRPESVTCLPCRDHAHRQYLELADQIEKLRGAGMAVSGEDLDLAVLRLREMAERFGG